MSKIVQSIKDKTYSIIQSDKQIAACPITGIILTLKDIPIINGYALEYKNPYAILKNAQDIASLPYSAKLKIPKTILAGCLLTLLYNKNILKDKLSASERNIVLSEASHHILHLMMHFLTNKHPATLLQLSISKEHTAYGINDMLQNYIKEHTTESTYTRKVEVSEITKTTKKAKPITVLSASQRKQLLSAIMSTIEENELPIKLQSILLLLPKNNNVLTMSQDIINRIVEKMNDLNTSSSLLLSSVIKQYRIKDQENTLEQFSDSIEKKRIAKNLTISQIVANRRATLEGKELPFPLYDEEEEQEEEQEEEIENEYPTFRHLDCDNCPFEKESCIEEIGYCIALEDKSLFLEQSILEEKKEENDF